MQEVYLIVAGVLVAISLATAGFSLYRTRQLQARLTKLLAGLDEAGNLEETLSHYFTNVKTVESQLDTIRKNYKHLTDIATASIQKTALVRFNPFKNTGGDQSFVLALLDNHDNGLLMTSIHSREGTRVYIKPIKYGSSEHTLSREEQSALAEAQGKDKTRKKNKTNLRGKKK